MERIKHWGRLAFWLAVLPVWFTYHTISFTVHGMLEGLLASYESWLRGWLYLRSWSCDGR